MRKIIISYLAGVITMASALVYIQHMQVPETSKRIIVTKMAATEA